MKKLILIPVIGASLLLGACSNVGSNAVVTINGEKVTEKQFYDDMKTISGKDVLNEVVYSKLLSEKYKASDKEIQKAIDDIKTSQGLKDDAALEAALEQSGVTMKRFKENMRLNVLMQKAQLDGVKVTDADIKKAFEAEKDDIRASHILVADEKTGNEVLEKLKSGEDFAKLAEKYSTDTASAAKGGDLGYFAKGSMVPEFEEAAYKLKAGEMSGLVKSQYGYHIIKVTAVGRKFEEEKEALKKQVQQSKAKTSDEVFQALLKDNDVKVNDKDLEKTFNTTSSTSTTEK